MNNDQERQPLLGGGNIEESINISNRKALKGLSIRKGRFTIITMLIILCGTMLIGLTLLNRHIPESKLLTEYIANITNVEVENVSFDGWEILEQERFYKLNIKSSASINYNAGAGLSKHDAEFISYMGRNVIKDICFDMKNLETFEEINETSSTSLATLRFPDTICISLTPEVVTKLNFTVLFRPHTKRIVPILKKIWDGDYTNINIWSNASITFKKQIFSYKMPILSLKISRVNWKDLGIWDKSLNFLRHLYLKITNVLKLIEINDLCVTDTNNGYSLESSIGVKGFLSEYDWPLDQDLLLLPEFIWHVSFPDCDNNALLELRNINVSSPKIMWGTINNRYLNLTIRSIIEGPLPDEFLNHVCASDDYNVVTAMSKLIRRLFDPEKLIFFELSCIDIGHSTPNDGLFDDLSSLVPYLDSPITLNYTVDINDIIHEVSTKGIKLKWTTDGFGRRKLYMMGKIVANVKIPHYQISERTRFFIDRIKGNTELYHNGVHMLTIPLDYWTPCETKTVIDDQSPENSFFLVSFDIDNDQVIVRNTMELSHCINEIIFKGESEVSISGKLDLMLHSPIGDIVLLGIPGEGNTVIR